MLRHWLAFSCGFGFAMGLFVAGMTNPAVVLGFLDIAGDWNPALLGTLGAAVLVYGVGYAIMRARLQNPYLVDHFSLPQKHAIDTPLVIGSAIFGIGWGIAGLCPGPAVALAVTGQAEILIFLLTMASGLIIGKTVVKI